MDIEQYATLVIRMQNFLLPFLRFFLDNVPIPVGFFLRTLLPIFGLYWLDFDDSRLECYEQYFIFMTTPKFDFSNVDMIGPDGRRYSYEDDENASPVDMNPKTMFSQWMRNATT